MKQALPVVFLLGACGTEAFIPRVTTHFTDQAAESWWSDDDPDLFGDSIERNIARLPTEGRASRTPWSGYYWPKYQDGINYRWAGPYSDSPARKYELAFGGWRTEDLVSAYHGVDSLTGAFCFNNNMCGGAMCARRAGQMFGRCMPLWFGICEAWATASILHPEPQRSVEYNGVVFEVSDLKALLSILYVNSTPRQAGLRCQYGGYEIPYDGAGRPTDLACRDTNPGTFHLLLANYLGMRGQPFVEDRDMTVDVWNQPITAYRVTQMQEIPASQANDALGIGNVKYPYNRYAERFMYVEIDVDFIAETDPLYNSYLGDIIDQFTLEDHYEYILELNLQGDILGGEWVGASKSNHPDFLWLPMDEGHTSIAGGAIRRDLVMMLVEASYAYP